MLKSILEYRNIQEDREKRLAHIELLTSNLINHFFRFDKFHSKTYKHLVQEIEKFRVRYGEPKELNFEMILSLKHIMKKERK